MSLHECDCIDRAEKSIRGHQYLEERIPELERECASLALRIEEMRSHISFDATDESVELREKLKELTERESTIRTVLEKAEPIENLRGNLQLRLLSLHAQAGVFSAAHVVWCTEPTSGVPLPIHFRSSFTEITYWRAATSAIEVLRTLHRPAPHQPLQLILQDENGNEHSVPVCWMSLVAPVLVYKNVTYESGCGEAHVSLLMCVQGSSRFLEHHFRFSPASSDSVLDYRKPTFKDWAPGSQRSAAIILLPFRTHIDPTANDTGGFIGPLEDEDLALFHHEKFHTLRMTSTYLPLGGGGALFGQTCVDFADSAIRQLSILYGERVSLNVFALPSLSMLFLGSDAVSRQRELAIHGVSALSIAISAVFHVWWWGWPSLYPSGRVLDVGYVVVCLLVAYFVPRAIVLGRRMERLRIRPFSSLELVHLVEECTAFLDRASADSSGPVFIAEEHAEE